jgi:hypothetical protein
VQGNDAAVHRVLRPAVAVSGKKLPQFASFYATADLAQNFFADRMLHSASALKKASAGSL